LACTAFKPLKNAAISYNIGLRETEMNQGCTIRVVFSPVKVKAGIGYPYQNGRALESEYDNRIVEM